MNQIGTTLSSVLIGALADGATSDAVQGALLAAGRPPEDVVVLIGNDGLDELLSLHHGFLPAITRLIRQLEALQSDGTGHVLEAAESSLRDGHDVVVVRHVDAPAAASLAGLLRANGVSHVHYIGRWTVAESGVVHRRRLSPRETGCSARRPGADAVPGGRSPLPPAGRERNDGHASHDVRSVAGRRSPWRSMAPWSMRPLVG